MMRYAKTKRWILVVVAVLAFMPNLQASDMRLSLFYGKQVQSFVFSVVEGEYMLSSDGHQVAVIRHSNMFHVELTASGMIVRDSLQSYGKYTNLEFKGVSATNIFQVKPVFPSLPSKESEDMLVVKLHDHSLSLVNVLDFEKYIPGIVESEGGPGAGIEYYKAQAVLARTFAVKNFTRHATEGFNLCDGVHCQAYNGKSRLNKLIYDACRETSGKILADNQGNPIQTAYHANCGGVTSSASMAWNKDLPWFVSIHDPFCDKSPQRDWKKVISLQDWNKYIDQKKSVMVTDQGSDANNPRKKYLVYSHKNILLTTVREDFKLPSAFFSAGIRGDSVILQGHGYGHGVGLCQDGAIEMSGVGYTWPDILMFYFQGVIITDRK